MIKDLRSSIAKLGNWDGISVWFNSSIDPMIENSLPRIEQKVKGHRIDKNRQFHGQSRSHFYIFRVAADSKSASSFRSLPKFVEISVQYNLKLTLV